MSLISGKLILKNTAIAFLKRNGHTLKETKNGSFSVFLNVFTGVPLTSFIDGSSTTSDFLQI